MNSRKWSWIPGAERSSPNRWRATGWISGGKPLIRYTIEAARNVFPDEAICVSTDDPAIRAVAESLGLAMPFQRPAELATDTAGTREVLLHALDFYEKKGVKPDTLVLLQATSPFLTGAHLSEALQLYDDDCEMVVSVKETRANPYFSLYEENVTGWLEKSKEGHFPTRQACPKVYELNGAIYILRVAALRMKPMSRFTRIRKYVMDERSSIDIDTMVDWKLAEGII